MARNNLIIYNLEMDINSRVLAANLDWVDAFAKIFSTVTVYTVHKGEYRCARNVNVIELGGGNTILRIRAITRLMNSVVVSARNRKQLVVFHHMSSKTAAVTGILYRILGVPQGLWYSHSVADMYLRISKYWIDCFFSSTNESFPLKHKNFHAVGHGIPTSKFKSRSTLEVRSNIVAVGRVVPIKRLEFAVEAISSLPMPDLIELHVIGEFQEKDPYFQSLVKLAAQKNVTLKMLGDVPYAQVQEILSRYSYIYSGTPKSIDKALLEGAAAGCLVISENTGANELTGMNTILDDFGIYRDSTLGHRLMLLQFLDSDLIGKLRIIIAEKTIATCDISKTAFKIAENLKAVKPLYRQ